MQSVITGLTVSPDRTVTIRMAEGLSSRMEVTGDVKGRVGELYLDPDTGRRRDVWTVILLSFRLKGRLSSPLSYRFNLVANRSATDQSACAVSASRWFRHTSS
jgi:hypothetical protein